MDDVARADRVIGDRLALGAAAIERVEARGILQAVDREGADRGGGEPALASPKLGLSEAAPAVALPEAVEASSETELLCAHAIRTHAQSSIGRYFTTFIFAAAAPD